MYIRKTQIGPKLNTQICATLDMNLTSLITQEIFPLKSLNHLHVHAIRFLYDKLRFNLH